MKNVAGYDLPRLWCGAFDRLGVLLELTFRLWPAPEARRSWILAGDSGALPILDEIARAAAGAGVRPDAVAWSRGEGVRLTLLGTEASVEARATALETWAADRGFEPSSATGGEPSPGPDGRDPDGSVVGLRLPRRRLARAVELVGSAVDPECGRLSAFPASSFLRVAYRRTEAHGVEILREIAGACPEAKIRVERGSAAELELAEDRRPEAERRMEGRVLDALEGRPRHPLADHL